MTPTKQNINQLIALCKKSNQRAQLEIYNRYYRAMYNAAFRIVKDSFEAEDIIQESFLTAFNKLDTLKDTKTFGAWLKRIVVNNSIYQYKRNGRYTEVPLDNIMYKVEDQSGIAEDYEFSDLKAKQVVETMKKLKDNYRVSLTLNLIEGYDYEEISEILNISYSSCRTTISRAKEKLRQELKDFSEYKNVK